MKNLIKKNFYFFLLFILLLPLFYINVKDSHGWGDDFAQYFLQARNIIEHRPQTDNGLVTDTLKGDYAVRAYPAGFPVLLAASWICFGSSIHTGSLLISLFCFALGLLTFFYLKRIFPQHISLLLALILIYNPWTIGFKKEILSDIPFAFFLLLGIFLFQSRKTKTVHYIFTGIIFGVTISIRSIGVVVLPAFGFYLLSEFLKFRSEKKTSAYFFNELKKIGLIIFSAFGFYFLLNETLFSISSEGILGFYANAMQGENFIHWIALNMEYYYEVWLNFFANTGGKFILISSTTKYLLLALLVAGIFISWIKKIGFDDWVVIAYLLFLLIYPYREGGFRFLLPLLPFFLKYIITSFNSLTTFIKIKSTNPSAAFLLFVLFQYTPGIIDQVKSTNETETGPQEKTTAEAFNFIRTNLSADAVVVFVKPRALSYYAQLRATYVKRNADITEMSDSFKRINAHYFLIGSNSPELNDVLLKEFLLCNTDKIKSVWQNQNFILYSDLK